MNRKILLGAIAAVSMLVLAASPASALYFTDLGGDLLEFDGTSSVVKIDFNKGGSDIRDDGNLWINTDDSVFFHAPTSVVMWTDALEFWPNLAKPTIDFKKGDSKIYDDGDLFIVTDDNLYLQGTVIPKGTVRPDRDDIYDLGTSTREWRNLYIDGTAYIDTLRTHGSTIAQGSIYPSAADSYDLGTENEEWRAIYVGDGNTALKFGLSQDLTMGWDNTNDALEILGDAVSVGTYANAATATEAGDLLVADALEVNGTTDLDGTLDVDGTANLDEVTVAGSLLITPRASATAGTEGVVYYDSDDDNLYVYADGSWVDLTAGAGSGDSLDDAYNNDAGGERTIIVDAGSVSWDLSSTYDFVVDIQGTGNFVVQDSGSAIFTVADGGGTTLKGTFTVGENNTGHDVRFYGAAAGASWLWDESADAVVITGVAGQDALNVAAGNVDFDGTMDVDGTSNLDEVSIQGTAIFGADGTGYSATWYSDISGDNMAWSDTEAKLTITGSAGTDALLVAAGNVNLDGQLDVDLTANLDEVAVAGNTTFAKNIDVDGTANLDEVTIAGNTSLTGDLTLTGNLDVDYTANLDEVAVAGNTTFAKNIDVDGTANLDEVDIDGTTQIDAAVTVGVNDTGYDVKFFGATAGKYWLWDESGDDMIVVGDAFVGATTESIANTSFAMDNNDFYVEGMFGVNAASYFDGTITVGLDGTGYDVTFYGATSGAYLLWDESADTLTLVGAAGLDVDGTTNLDEVAVAGNTTFAKNIDVDGTANLDEVDIDGTTQIDATVTVGVDGTGYDVKFYGATSGAYMLWDESANKLIVAGSAGTDAIQASAGNVDFDANIDVDGTANLDEVAVAGNTTFAKNIDVDGTANLDEVVIAGMADLNGQLDVDLTANLDEVAVAGNATFAKNIDVDGTANLDEVVIAGNTSLTGDLAMTGDYALTGNLDVDYTANLDEVAVAGNATFASAVSVTGNATFSANIDVNGTANLDEVDIDGNTDIDGVVTFGTDGTGYSATWYSDISGDNMAWSDTEAKLTITGSAGTDALDVADGDVYIRDFLKLGKQTASTTGADTTITPTASYMELTFTTAGDDIIIGTTGAAEGDVLFIVNVGTNTGQLDGDTTEMKIDGGADLDMSQYDGVIFIFDGTNWIQMTKIPTNS